MQRELHSYLHHIDAHIQALLLLGSLSERQLIIMDAIQQGLERVRLILDDPMSYFKNSTSDEDFLAECANPARLAHFVAFDLNNPVLIIGMSARILLNHERADFTPLTESHRTHLGQIEKLATTIREGLTKYRQ